MPSKRDPHAHFTEILNAVDLIQQYIAGSSFDTFEENIQLQDSVIRRLAILADAGNRLTPEEQALCPGIDWRAIHGLGNRLRHEYDGIDIETVWNIIHKDLPVLHTSAEQAIRNHFPNTSEE